jgi:undecaprenyl-diphosphatase
MTELDRQLFLFFNGLHHPVTDAFWLAMSDKWMWLFYLLPAVYFMVRRFGKKSFIPLLFIPILFLVADQGSNLAKMFFARPRPCRAEELTGLVHVIAPRCSLYGFWSAHAANAFAQVSFFFFLAPAGRGKTARIFHGFIFVWAVSVAMSRVMVGVHYPGDILVGAIYGSFCGWVLYQVFKRVEGRLGNVHRDD